MTGVIHPQNQEKVSSKDKTAEIKRGRARATNALGQSTKDRIVQAYAKLIRRRRTADVSVDDIAAAAKVKKGTLLYHFGSKEGLQLQMVRDYAAHLEERYQAGIREARKKWPELPDAVAGFAEWYRWFYASAEPGYTDYGLAILSLAAKNSKLIEPVNSWYESVFARIRESAGPESPAIVTVLALEGLFYLNHFHVNALPPGETDALLKRLLAPELYEKPQR
jgi:AcrR family transcriptional regulator